MPIDKDGNFRTNAFDDGYFDSDVHEDERARVEDIEQEAKYYDQAKSNYGKRLPCDKCKGKITMTDVEGHYSGVCAHCRGDE